ncbi:MAG: sensor histidine kinase, partial [Terriglobia bacterium]
GASAGSQQIKSILESRDGTIWVGTVAGLFRLKGGKIAHTPVDHAVEANICQDQSGNVWVGWVGGGLSRIHNGKSVTYRAPAVLPGNTVLSIHEDCGRNLWIGTENGLLRLSYTGVSILERRDGLPLGNASTIYENVSTIYAAPDGTLWIANGHLYRILHQQIVRYHLPRQIQNVNIRTVYEDRRGVLWIGTGGQGVIALRDGKVTRYTAREGLTNDFIRAFCEDRRGDLWIGTDGGVSRWNGKSFKNFNASNGLVYPSVRAIVQGNNGDLWIATDGGLSLFRNGSFVHNPVLHHLRGYRIWAIHQDEETPGVLWLGTRGDGLFRLKDGRLAHYTAKSGLPNEDIYQILQDKRGNLWMSSPAGVFRVQLKSLDAVAAGKARMLAVTVYRASEGLPVTETNGGVQPAGTSTRSGTLWFPTYKGAIRIEPEEVRSSPAGRALIEDVVADGRHIPLKTPCRIQPGDGRLEIQYTAPSLLAPERTRFKYKLVGFDKQWTFASSRRVAYYTNLPPGKYRFQVMAFDNGSARATPEADFSFTWEAHFYQTAWFYILCGLSLAMLGWAAYRMHLARTKARFAAVLAERTRLAREIHDTIIQGCVGVSTLLEAAVSFDHSPPAIVLDLLDRARTQVRQTLNEARESVWDLRHSGLEDGGIASALLREVRRLSGESGIPVEAEVMGTPAPLESRAQVNLLLVAREAMRNAIAHANPHRVQVRLAFTKDRLSMEISDDGCGFDPKANGHAEHQHYGIVGMRERVEQLGGQFELISSLGEGAHVFARIPLRGATP